MHAIIIPYNIIHYVYTAAQECRRPERAANTLIFFTAINNRYSSHTDAAGCGTVRGTLPLGNSSLLLHCIYYAEVFAL